MYGSRVAALRGILRIACLPLIALVRNMSLCGSSGVTHLSAASFPPSSARLLRLPPVPGSGPHATNELLLFLPQPSPGLKYRHAPRSSGHPPPQHHVVYFPGDVQNYRSIMACHPENVRWECWSLENTATVLARRFPNSHIWIIKSSRMHLYKFSCYDNFVANNMFGAPEHSTDYGAFKHLYALLTNAFTLAENTLSQSSMYCDDEDTEVTSCTLIPTCSTNGCPEDKAEYSKQLPISFGSPSERDSVSFSLIGFSKGCVVLNQLLYELNEAKRDKDLNSFITNIKAMYWLDGGHSGGSNTWITCSRILKGFAQTGIAVHTHVTPYQVQDSMRSWIGKEHKKFVQILTEFGVQVNNQLHFTDEAPSLDNHFRVHDVF